MGALFRFRWLRQIYWFSINKIFFRNHPIPVFSLEQQYSQIFLCLEISHFFLEMKTHSTLTVRGWDRSTTPFESLSTHKSVSFSAQVIIWPFLQFSLKKRTHWISSFRVTQLPLLCKLLKVYKAVSDLLIISIFESVWLPQSNSNFLTWHRMDVTWAQWTVMPVWLIEGITLALEKVWEKGLGTKWTALRPSVCLWFFASSLYVWPQSPHTTPTIFKAKETTS